MKKSLFKSSKIMAACAALGLLGLHAPATLAAQVSINLSGTYTISNIGGIPSQPTPQPFTAMLTYDTDTVFTAYGPTSFEAGDLLHRVGNLGSITVHANGLSDTSTIFGIVVDQNSDSGNPGSIYGPATHSYSATILFYSEAYYFSLHSYASPTPYIWDGNLLPTPENPIPFTGAGQPAMVGLQPMQIFGVSMDIDNYSVSSASAVPVPAAAWLFGTGLVGLGGLVRRQRLANAAA